MNTKSNNNNNKPFWKRHFWPKDCEVAKCQARNWNKNNCDRLWKVRFHSHYLPHSCSREVRIKTFPFLHFWTKFKSVRSWATMTLLASTKEQCNLSCKDDINFFEGRQKVFSSMHRHVTTMSQNMTKFWSFCWFFFHLANENRQRIFFWTMWPLEFCKTLFAANSWSTKFFD